MKLVQSLFWTIGLGLTALAMQPASAMTQAAGSPVPSLDSIGPGCCTLRIRQSGQVARGRFQGKPDRESVLLEPCSGLLCGAVAGSARTVRLVPGAQVEMRSGTQAGKGFFFGSVAGAGLLLGLVLIDGCDCEMSAGDYAVLGVVGAAGGGAIGALVGAFMPNWVPVRP
jgi:hypothetical protein